MGDRSSFPFSRATFVSTISPAQGAHNCRNVNGISMTFTDRKGRFLGAFTCASLACPRDIHDHVSLPTSGIFPTHPHLSTRNNRGAHGRWLAIQDSRKSENSFRAYPADTVSSIRCRVLR